MFNYYWQDAIKNILKMGRDEIFVRQLCSNILHNCEQGDFLASSKANFGRIISILISEYFSIFWEVISPGLLTQNYNTYFHLKTLLGSEIGPYQKSVSTLFELGDLELIRAWIVHTGRLAANRIAGLVPIFSTEMPVTWYPLTKFLIDEFGAYQDVLNKIYANVNSFGTIGSVVPHLENQATIFRQLYDHHIDNVRTWARANVAELELRIREEGNKDVETFL